MSPTLLLAFLGLLLGAFVQNGLSLPHGSELDGVKLSEESVHAFEDSLGELGGHVAKRRLRFTDSRDDSPLMGGGGSSGSPGKRADMSINNALRLLTDMVIVHLQRQRREKLARLRAKLLQAGKRTDITLSGDFV